MGTRWNSPPWLSKTRGDSVVVVIACESCTRQRAFDAKENSNAMDAISLTPRFNGVIGRAEEASTVSTVSRPGLAGPSPIPCGAHDELSRDGRDRGKPLKRFHWPTLAHITRLKRGVNESFAKSQIRPSVFGTIFPGWSLREDSGKLAGTHE